MELYGRPRLRCVVQVGRHVAIDLCSSAALCDYSQKGILMATIHLVKNGKKANGDRITRSEEMPMDLAMKKLSGYQMRYSERPPTINSEVVASDFAPFKHVVIEVGETETNHIYTKHGYYVVVGLDASECQQLFGLSGSLV